ncbi:Aspartic peptidase domain superfamily [Sesbania bispinosa]|nr:Aspartic peptidase domain superfamily [Sesbania bispinosa]
MAENTRLKELTANIKRIMEIMESKDKESNARFETIEVAVETQPFQFSPNHRCPNKQYLWLHMEEEDVLDPKIEPPDQVSEPQSNATQEHHLSYNALNGSSGLGTMKFQGVINGMTVQVLLDGGSSDNFLQPRLAHCLKLPVEPIQHMQVVVGNGAALSVEGWIRELEVKIQGHSLKLPVYLLHVSGADLVLGAEWLATLGPYISDYSTLTVKFFLGNRFITLHGERPRLPSQAQFSHLRRMCHTNAISEIYTMKVEHPDVPEDKWLELPPNMEPELVVLLHAYKDVFEHILESCNQNKPPHPNFTSHDQLLYWKGRLVIPAKHSLVDQILNEFHSSLIGGHVGYARTMARIAAQFY